MSEIHHEHLNEVENLSPEGVDEYVLVVRNEIGDVLGLVYPVDPLNPEMTEQELLAMSGVASVQQHRLWTFTQFARKPRIA